MKTIYKYLSILLLALASGCISIEPGPMQMYELELVDPGNAYIGTHTVYSWGTPTAYKNLFGENLIYVLRMPDGNFRYT